MALSELRATEQQQRETQTYFNEAGKVLSLWEQLPQPEKLTSAHSVAGLHVDRAEWLASQNEFEEAAVELRAEASVQDKFGGSLEFHTKSPDQFFRKLVTIQAAVADNLGLDPLAGLVTYSFEKNEDGFRGSRVERFRDIMGIEVPDLRDEERIATVHEIRKVGGNFDVVKTRWLIIREGELPGALAQASHSIQFDEDGKLEITQQLSKKGDRPARTESAQGEGAEAAVEPIRKPSLVNGAETLHPDTTLRNAENKTATWLIIPGAFVLLGVVIILVRVFMRRGES